MSPICRPLGVPLPAVQTKLNRLLAVLRHQTDWVRLGEDRPIGTAKLIALHFHPHRQPWSL